MINAGRSLDDTPSLAVQAGRVNAVVPAVATLERLLARGQLPGPVLTNLQKLMEDESTHPLALICLRGDRAAREKLMDRVRAGTSGVSSLFDSPTGSPPGFLYSWRMLRENQAELLERNTELVELARLPAEQQGPAFRRFFDDHSQHWNQSGWVDRVFTFPFHNAFQESLVTGMWQSRHRANLNLAILAVASERFRLDHGRWPESPAELVPSYLSSIPHDPHSGGPLRWKRAGKDLLIYSVGVNGVDDGGVWPRGNPYGYNQDLGFRLDDPEARVRRSAAKP